MRQYLTDLGVKSQMDLERQSITTKFAAYGLIAATARDPGTRKAYADGLVNALDTGSFTLTKNQQLVAQDKSRGRDQTDRESFGLDALTRLLRLLKATETASQRMSTPCEKPFSQH